MVDTPVRPSKRHQISFPGRTTTYTLQTEKEHTSLINFMGFPTSQAIVVKTLITSKRAKHFTPARKSPVKRYTERLIQNESLAQYQYFSDNEHYYLNPYLVSAASAPGLVPCDVMKQICDLSEKIASLLSLKTGIFL